MPFRSKNMVRETVAAFAVLVIYALVLLLPLHQAAGLQRDLAKIGFETITASSICMEPAPRDDGGSTPSAVKCAAAGIAKHKFATIEPGSVAIRVVRTTDPARYAAAPRLASRSIHEHPSQARAPPMTV
ncbi:MAG: hypothetical protein JWQ89_2896 [Devosia sp.]|uniref:hypothetical protein n=1 Tax=Devosia sp. TaxID=1871048 RepID=UPI0026382828|nr:hypothetical protein [Devosia sp.]MDB5541169.1 hypothetical protein [Devosia sp.]